MRVAVLWTTLSGYLNACMKELASRDAVELFVSHQAPLQQAPYDDSQFAWIHNRLVLQSTDDFDPLARRLEEFNPEIIAFCGWHVPAYRRAAKALAGRCMRVMFMDNCWNATPKQRLGTLVAPWYVRPLADLAWVPGERQAVFARRLGFEQRNILWGSLSCDQQLKPCTLRALKRDVPCPIRFCSWAGLFPRRALANWLVPTNFTAKKRSIHGL
jgi:hypothetical protein